MFLAFSHYAATFPPVAYNSTDNEYLVVWSGDDNIPPLASWEIGTKNPGGNVYVLGGDTKFQISTNISAESADDREVAVKLAQAVLKSCQ